SHRAREGEHQPYKIRAEDSGRLGDRAAYAALHTHRTCMRTNPSPWRFRVAVSAMSLAAVLSGCGSTSRDESARWTPERLYSEAKEEAAAGNYEKAIKLYERLEGRAAGSVLAQQAQIERAYYLWKSGEKAQALSTL